MCSNLETIYHFKSLKLKQYIDENGKYETTANVRINGKCDYLLLTEHKYLIVSYLLLFKKAPSIYKTLYYYCT